MLSTMESTRHSPGLDQFIAAIQDEPGLNILDLSGASQANINFITNLGHGIYAEDFLSTLDQAFGAGDFYQNQTERARIEAFFEQNLNFPDGHFDGAMVWDVLQYLAPPMLQMTVDRLYRLLKPGSYLLSFFYADEKAQSIPVNNYRIASAKTLTLNGRGQRRPAQFFNNRGLEKLFQNFASVKFFLTRDHLREIIVKR